MTLPAITCTSSEPINTVLAEHQRRAERWRFAELAASLHTWAEWMIFGFKLEIGTPALLITQLRRNCLGHYRRGRNGFGLRDEIGIDQEHARISPYWEVLGTLLHELIHAWQEHHGKPSGWNYHNKEFCRKAAELGLIVDRFGHTTYAPPSTPFTQLLDRHGVTVPHMEQSEPTVRPVSRSKLKLYMCPCGVRVRVGRSIFRAVCLDCSGEFRLKS